MTRYKVSPTWRLILGYIAFLVLLLMMLVSSGCRSLKEKSLAYAMENPSDFSKFCGDYYPPKDSVGKPKVIYIPADNKNHQDEINKLYDKVDSLQVVIHQDKTDCGVIYLPVINDLKGQVKKLKDFYKPCVPDTAFITEKHYITNIGKVTDLSNKLSDLTDKYQSLKDSSTTKTYWIIGLSVLIVIALIILIKRK